MKPGRNDPCPCGSGKKYKKCCYLTEQNTPRGQDDDDRDEQELFFKAMNNLRKFTLDRKPHIREYYKNRKMHSEIVNAMIKYFDDGKFKQKFDSTELSQNESSTTIHLIGSSFDLGTRAGGQAFYDRMIYKTAPNANCITEDFIQNRRYRKPEKIEFLQNMLNSTLGLFEITGTDFKEGYVYIREVFTGAEHTIIDVGLSGDPNYAEFYLYTRLITHNGITFGTGLNLVFAKTDEFIKNHIRRHKKDYNPNGEMLRFTQLYNRYIQYHDNVRIVDNTLK